jgi:chemotaxis response regulator CheB
MVESRHDPRNGVLRDIVVIGASAGGLPALEYLATALPQSFPAALIVAMHNSARSLLAPYLATRAYLPVQWASDRMPICRQNIYLAPPDRQLAVDRGVLRVEASPREGVHRPSINLLFRSAAAAYGQRVIGVIMTGTLNDGTAGLWHIKRRGGIAVVQDPSDAEFPAMPRNAMNEVAVDFVLPLDLLTEKLIELTRDNGDPSESERPARILIVEDEAISAGAIAERLRLEGYDVVGPVRSGADAMDLAASERPDLVLMDIQLEGSMSGIEAARAIWEKFRIPTVYITAFSDSDTLDRVNGAECYGYIAKPFHSTAVRAAVGLAIKRHQKEMLPL